MFGMQVLVILGVLGALVIGVPTVLYFVIRAAVRDGNRDSSPGKEWQDGTILHPRLSSPDPK